MNPTKFYGIGFSEPTEFVVCWNLGNSCNWNCEYCPSYLNNASVYWTENELVKTTLKKLKQYLNIPIRVEFMGGEVTLKPDFIDLMQFCREQGFNNYIVTNASRTINYWEKLSPYLDQALCTFHPLNADKQHYENVLDTMLKNNCKPVVNIAMVKNTFWDMIEYKKYLHEKYNNTIHVDFLLLYDKERKYNYNGYFYNYDPSQLNFFKQHIGKHFTIEFEDGSRRAVSFAEVREENLNNFFGYMCGSKLNMLNIDYYGGTSISACNQRRPINVSQPDFIEYLKPKICQSTECRNPSDLRILKVKQ